MKKQAGAILLVSLIVVLLVTILTVTLAQLIQLQWHMLNSVRQSEQLLSAVIETARGVEQALLQKKTIKKQSIQKQDIHIDFSLEKLPIAPCLQIIVLARKDNALLKKGVELYRLILVASNSYFQHKRIQLSIAVPANVPIDCLDGYRTVNLGWQSWLELD